MHIKKDNQVNIKPKSRWQKFYSRLSLHTVISMAFTFTAVFAIAVTGFSFYKRFEAQARNAAQAEYQSVIEQIDSTFAYNARSLMQISDALTYDIIKNNNFSQSSVNNQFNLVYQTNKEAILNIALFSMDGTLLDVAPAAIAKQNINISEQAWFNAAVEKPENLHFSMPHVQNLFENNENIYQWVISLSQVVDLNYAGKQTQGVLLIDVKYTSIEDVLSGLSLGENGYVYLMSSTGEIIYHPHQQLIWANRQDEINYKLAQYSDGTYKEQINGVENTAVIKTVGYTGWRIVGVTPYYNMALSNLKSNLFLLWMLVLFLGVLLNVNNYISRKVSSPILELEKSVKKIADGDLQAQIPTRGSFEVWHLENEIRKMVLQLQKLMDDIVLQQETMRKSELDVLQAQINPHFLYNTLDIIVWMIENKQHDEAVKAGTALGRFFRISLSKGKATITVSEEIEHVRNYLMIQEMRYKNKFTYSIFIDPQIEKSKTVKLILQPLVENAIYHGMEFMDGDGRIEISAKQQQKDIVFEIKDNGPGMPQETVKKLMQGDIQPSKRGSGIGVRNVQERLQLTYGKEYGLTIISEPDEGTTILIKIKNEQ